jgi:arsenate reductase
MAVSPEPLEVLVVCTGNSCRSIIAEALINALGDGRYRAKSAGSQPVGYVHPKALEVLRRHGIDPGDPRSESWDDYVDESFDYVITVCDSAAAEPCPAFPGRFQRLHWSTPDPARATGTDQEIDAAFEAAFQLLEARVEAELL